MIGELLGKTGPWIGIEYDLPVGKHDGSVEGHYYFKCNPKCGVIVKPERVTVGDYPEDDFGLDEL
jgi:tubulin-folding cofactor B